MRVQATTEFSYDGKDRKVKDIFDIEDGHFLPLQLCGRVMKVEDEASPPKMRYKHRAMRAEE